ncbi:hypothetical protein L1049_028048 [Liquidambar formosana]|uniref:U-box domain-containing protein n=1 Tax=Liquidambar formosana TaxID=63359 RepID=A0AAP0WT08_LIQFO
MISFWRRRRNGRRADKKQEEDLEIVIPNHFQCPISLDLMKDPVTLSSGITYDRESIERWLEDGNFTCPVTNQVLRNFDQIPNHIIRKMIQEWCVENRRFGFERIPTPRIPVAPIEVSKILYEISTSTQHGNPNGCLELVKRIEDLGAESERNKRCILESGAACVLSAAFDAFATDCFERNANVLEEILSALNWMFPLDVEAQTYLGSSTSIRCMVWFLKCGDLSTIQSSILALKELASSDEKYVETLVEIEGVREILVKLIKEPICPAITKASLMVIFCMVSSSSSSEVMRPAFVEMGMVPLLLEVLINSERSICESALGLFERLCSCEEGREKAYSNALTMPVLVKKILRVSELATEFSVSTIWKLCKYERRNEGSVVVEALQVGAFQKLLLLLQVGCGDETKEKTTELLKLLNPYRAGLECIESTDFKNLKRPF